MPKYTGTNSDETVNGFTYLADTFDNFGLGADTLSGGIRDDVFNLLVDAKTDTIAGGAGEDLINYSQSDRGLTIDLSAGHVTAWFANTTTSANGFPPVSVLQLGTVANVSGIEDVIGSRFGDTIIGTSDSNVLEGGGGADYINGGSGSDTASYAHSSAGVQINLNNVVQHDGDAEGDQLYSIENVIGSAYADSILGKYAGNNLIEGGGGADYLNGGSTTTDANGLHIRENTVSYLHSTAGVQVNLGQVVQHGGDAEGDQLYGFDKVLGSAYNDQLAGNAANNTIKGEGGDDTIIHTGGGDFVDGGVGVDTYVVGHLDSDYGVTITLDDQQVGLEVTETPLGVSTLTPLAGTYVEYATASGTVFDQLTHIENLVGSQNDDWLDASHVDPAVGTTIRGGGGLDHILGSAGNDYLYGGWDNDQLFGGAGDDRLYGQDGDDKLVGGAGADYLDGGLGNNTALYSDSASGVTVALSTTSVIDGAIVHIGHGLRGDAEGDTLVNIQNIVGSQFADKLIGDDRSNTLSGGLGNDILTGGAGRDTLIVEGTINSLGINPGNKILTGGADADTFDFQVYSESSSGLNIGNNTITDFQVGIDSLKLSDLGTSQGVHVAQVGNDAVVTVDHVVGSITLLDMHAADVHWII